MPFDTSSHSKFETFHEINAPKRGYFHHEGGGHFVFKPQQAHKPASLLPFHGHSMILCILVMLPYVQ